MDRHAGISLSQIRRIDRNDGCTAAWSASSVACGRWVANGSAMPSLSEAPMPDSILGLCVCSDGADRQIQALLSAEGFGGDLARWHRR